MKKLIQKLKHLIGIRKITEVTAYKIFPSHVVMTRRGQCLEEVAQELVKKLIEEGYVSVDSKEEQFRTLITMSINLVKWEDMK